MTSQPSVAVLSDLDRTLIYSAAALELAEPDHEAPRLLCVEVHEGRPLSYVTERAAAGITELTNAGVLVPVTTRTPEQFLRVHLPGATPKFAITANGGRLLRDGVEDLDFTAAVAARLEAGGAPAAEVHAELTRVGRTGHGPRFVRKVRDAAGLFSYAVVDRAEMPAGWLADLTAYCSERNWTVSVQGRKVYCVPVGLSKAAAAREVADMLGAELLLSAGDSLLDRPLLEVADRAIRPRHGELEDAGFRLPTLTVTESRGAAGGEQIVDWFLEQLA